MPSPSLPSPSSPGSDDLPGALSLEQQFKLQALSRQIALMTPNQARDLALELIRQGMVKDNLFAHLLKNA
ncbi:MAG: NblA/ycf18 family protein [Cyanobacteria bacterium P01_H01_bin.105]